MLREDNLGLGAKIGGGNAETFGLSMFSGLLGRLNGKSDVEVKEKQDKLRDAELRTYTGRKYGYMNFVSGGLLVGDKMEDKPPAAKSSSSSKKRKADEAVDEEDTQVTKSRKIEPESRSGAITEGLSLESGRTEKSKSKKDKKISKSGDTATHESAKSDSDSNSQSEDAAKEEKRKRKERRKAEKSVKSSKSTSEDDEKARLKQEKRARKEERRKRKEEKRQKKAAKEAAKSQEASVSSSESEGTATPPVSTNAGGRQAVRQRYIASKRMASMDPQALKEIFMLQAKAAA